MCETPLPKEFRKKSTTTTHHDDGTLTFAQWLWLKFRHVSSFALYSSFFLRLASNTLAAPTFVTFALQERHFLTAFARAYEMVEPYADDDFKSWLLRLRSYSLDRLQQHDAVMQMWGFNFPIEGVSYDASPATTKYTDFLLATVSGELIGDRGGADRFLTRDEKTKLALYVLAAVAPFMRLWGFVASEIKAVLDPNDKGNPYCKWLDDTSSRGFQATASALDWVSFDKSRDELEIVERLYHHALKLLVEFIFDSALPIPQKDVAPVSRVHDFTNCQLTIFCEFDLACAVYGSFDMLIEISRNVPRSKSQGSRDQLTLADIKSHAFETQLDQSSSAEIKSHASETQLNQLSSADIKTRASETQLDQLSSDDIKSHASETQLDQSSSAEIKSHASEAQLDQSSSANKERSWGIVIKQYTKESEQCLETILTSEKVEGFRYEDLCSALEQVGDFVRNGNERVVQSGLLKGLRMLDIKQAGQTLLYDDCRSFFQRILNNENLRTDVHIISNCWCDDIINSAFSTGGNLYNFSVNSNQLDYEQLILDGDLSDSNVQSNELGCEETISTGDLNDSAHEELDRLVARCRGYTENLNDLAVHSNKLPYVELITTGEIIRKLETPLDKLQVFHGKLTEHCRNIEKDHDHLTIYIGGSVGDFLCLLQADIGIVTGLSPALWKIGDHFGITFAPLFPAVVKKQQQLSAINGSFSLWKPMSGILYTVASWAEIHAFILGGTSLT